jgi:hypothetical protein
LMSYEGCCAPPRVPHGAAERLIEGEAHYASLSVTLPSPEVSAAPRNPETR